MLHNFLNYPSYKLLLIENSDKIVAVNNNGIIEIFSKSYHCEVITEDAVEFENCTC